VLSLSFTVLQFRDNLLKTLGVIHIVEGPTCNPSRVPDLSIRVCNQLLGIYLECTVNCKARRKTNKKIQSTRTRRASDEGVIAGHRTKFCRAHTNEFCRSRIKAKHPFTRRVEASPNLKKVEALKCFIMRQEQFNFKTLRAILIVNLTKSVKIDLLVM
jgi:hypothetical protein